MDKRLAAADRRIKAAHPATAASVLLVGGSRNYCKAAEVNVPEFVVSVMPLFPYVLMTAPLRIE